MEADAGPFDCQRCGACCIGLDVLLDAAEVRYFQSDSTLATLVVEHRGGSGLLLHFMRRQRDTDRCVALEGPLCDNRCLIYEQRPRLCRELAPGSEHCLAARRRVRTTG